MKRLKQLREEKHLSQQRLAMELNVSQATVSKYELGQADPDIIVNDIEICTFSLRKNHICKFLPRFMSNF